LLRLPIKERIDIRESSNLLLTELYIFKNSEIQEY